MHIRKLVLASFFLASTSLSAESLNIYPSTFDFGWCPDNVRIQCEFEVKNQSNNLVPIVDVQPSCGCTASDFSPTELSSKEHFKIGLTFNTRGYKGRAFNKRTKVVTDYEEESYIVRLKGHVEDPAAQVVPIGNGIVNFEKETTLKTQVVEIKNKTNKELILSVVQPPADWARYKIPKPKLKPGKTTKVLVIVEPPYEEAKYSSLTLEAKNKVDAHRLTLAVRTGPAPPAHKPIPRQAPVRPASNE